MVLFSALSSQLSAPSSRLGALALVCVLTGAADVWAQPAPWKPSAEIFEYRDSGRAAAWQSSTIIGEPKVHTTRKDETLLDIARRYHLGYLEIVRANPKVDPWIPGVGSRIAIPSQWILPQSPRRGIVLNIPEMRLYYYLPGSRVMTFPLGVGTEGWDTPPGRYSIGGKRTDPVWHVPPSIQKEMEHPVKVVPAGPDNPLGKYWMRLSGTSYGIHGTNKPWGVGRYVSHGCIRLYPEDIAYLYARVRPRTPVMVMYQYAKVGFEQGVPYFQIYRHRSYTDGQLMHDLIEQTWKLGIHADLRKLRRLLLQITEGAIVPIPLKGGTN
jgi:L,D-transpeptidase ErfK/SrfK